MKMIKTKTVLRLSCHVEKSGILCAEMVPVYSYSQMGGKNYWKEERLIKNYLHT